MWRLSAAQGCRYDSFFAQGYESCGVWRFLSADFVFAGGNVLSDQVSVMRFWERYRFVLNRLVGGVHIPRHGGTFAVIGLISAIACFGMIIGGHTLQTVKLASSVVGLGVDKIQVRGNKHTSEIAILQALGLDGDTALPVLNIEQARSVLAALPWVEYVSVRKIYPNALEISIVERQAFALWQEAGVVSVIDSKGRAIIPYNHRDGKGLPLFVGQGAAGHAREFSDALRAFPDIRSHARAFVRIGDRRWDIVMDNGLRIKLPEERPFVRLAEAYALDKREGLFSRDITELDLRLEDRMTVALSESALERYRQQVKEQKKLEQALKAKQSAPQTAQIKSGRAA